MSVAVGGQGKGERGEGGDGGCVEDDLLTSAKMTSFLSSPSLPPSAGGLVEGVDCPEVQAEVVAEMLDHDHHVLDKGVVELRAQIVHPPLVVADCTPCKAFSVM